MRRPPFDARPAVRVRWILPIVLLALAEPAAGQVAPYWLVSTRCCPQRPGELATGPCPRVLYVANGSTTEVGMQGLVDGIDPGRPVVVFVHGSLHTLETSMRDVRLAHRWLAGTPGDDVQFIAFAWPSEMVTYVLPGVDVNILGRRAEFNGYYLARLLSTLPAGAPVTLVGHSHGTRVIAAAMELQSGGTLQSFRLQPGTCGNARVRVVFLASAMDAHWMHPSQRYGRSWRSIDALLHFRNERDAALELYALRKPFSRHALGRVGFGGRTVAALGNDAHRLVELDVSAMIGAGHVVENYASQPVLADRIRDFTTREDVIVSRDR